jgi:cytochrome c556
MRTFVPRPSWWWLLPVVAACASKPEPHEPPQQAQLTRAVSAPGRLQPPETLPGPALAVLKTRMASHARDMGDLMSAIMILDYPRIQDRATAIADDASLARPLTQDATELNSFLPEAFFQYQDALRAEARALAGAAGRLSAFEVADHYGKLSETCVRCHATYRAGR